MRAAVSLRMVSQWWKVSEVSCAGGAVDVESNEKFDRRVLIDVAIKLGRGDVSLARNKLSGHDIRLSGVSFSPLLAFSLASERVPGVLEKRAA